MKKLDDHISDEILVKKYAKTDDIAYLVEAYKRYMSLVYGVALKYLKRPEDAQDAVMQLFEDLVVKAKTYTIDNFKSWLYVCIRNQCLMELRKKNRNLTVSLDDSIMDFCNEWHLDNINEEGLLDGALKDCMEALPDKQKISVNYFFFDNLSYKEIEEKTGFSDKMVKSFIQNGKRNLKLCLENKGISSYEQE